MAYFSHLYNQLCTLQKDVAGSICSSTYNFATSPLVCTERFCFPSSASTLIHTVRMFMLCPEICCLHSTFSIFFVSNLCPSGKAGRGGTSSCLRIMKDRCMTMKDHYIVLEQKTNNTYWSIWSEEQAGFPSCKQTMFQSQKVVHDFCWRLLQSLYHSYFPSTESDDDLQICFCVYTEMWNLLCISDTHIAYKAITENSLLAVKRIQERERG